MPRALRPSGPYTSSEWRSLVVVLTTLPSTLSSLVITTELPPSSLLPADTPDAHAYLSKVPDWPAIAGALDRFTSLERLVWLRRASFGGIYQDEAFDLDFQKLIKDKLDTLSGVRRVLEFGKAGAQ